MDDPNAWLKDPAEPHEPLRNWLLIPSELMIRINCDHCPGFYRVIPSVYPPNLQWVSTHLRDNPEHTVSMSLTGVINEES